MKGFTRTELRFSQCGLNCALCSMHLGGYCPGCGGGTGNQSCAIARCSLEHGGVAFCWECPEYPCARYDGFDDADSFIPHRGRARDAEAFRALGADAYFARLCEKREILGLLLAEYNDGRRKTFAELGRPTRRQSETEKGISAPSVLKRGGRFSEPARPAERCCLWNTRRKNCRKPNARSTPRFTSCGRSSGRWKKRNSPRAINPRSHWPSGASGHLPSQTN